MKISSGLATVSVKTSSDMVIAGGILPAFHNSKESPLDVTAVVFKNTTKTVCLITCDNLMMDRIFVDDVIAELEERVGIPFNNFLVSSTHTHHAPSMMKIHGYGPDERAKNEYKKAIFKAVEEALANCVPSVVQFCSVDLPDVGANSRRLLDDGLILWVPQLEEYLKFPPTGPYDPELSICYIKRTSPEGEEGYHGIWFNHSCHNIGSLTVAQSPGFYGLAAQQLAAEFHCPVAFFSGASGSTHDFSRDASSLIAKVKQAVSNQISHDQKRETPDSESIEIGAIKEEFNYKVRVFDEREEDDAVRKYCETMDVSDCGDTEEVIKVFKDMRKHLYGLQGDTLKSWIQVINIGDVAIVGLPGEVFTSLGMEIKQKSPFRQTIIIQLANDAIGYIPDEKAYSLGGYQLWTGYHSLLPKGTGEELVKHAISLLTNLKKGY